MEGFASVGVGGVTNVVGVSMRFGGVNGTEVSMGLPRGFGVSGRSWLAESWVPLSFGVGMIYSLVCCASLPDRLFRLFLLLDDLNNPPKPPLLPAAPLADSSPLDFLRDNVKGPRSLLPGEAVRSGMGGVEAWSTLS